MNKEDKIKILFSGDKPVPVINSKKFDEHLEKNMDRMLEIRRELEKAIGRLDIEI